MNSTSNTIANQLRQQLSQQPSLNELAWRAGVSQPSLSRFVNGKRDITLATASKVAKELGLELQQAPSPAVKNPHNTCIEICQTV